MFATCGCLAVHFTLGRPTVTAAKRRAYCIAPDPLALQCRAYCIADCLPRPAAGQVQATAAIGGKCSKLSSRCVGARGQHNANRSGHEGKLADIDSQHRRTICARERVGGTNWCASRIRISVLFIAIFRGTTCVLMVECSCCRNTNFALQEVLQRFEFLSWAHKIHLRTGIGETCAS